MCDEEGQGDDRVMLLGRRPAKHSAGTGTGLRGANAECLPFKDLHNSQGQACGDALIQIRLFFILKLLYQGKFLSRPSMCALSVAPGWLCRSPLCTLCTVMAPWNWSRVPGPLAFCKMVPRTARERAAA